VKIIVFVYDNGVFIGFDRIKTCSQNLRDIRRAQMVYIDKVTHCSEQTNQKHYCILKKYFIYFYIIFLFIPFDLIQLTLLKLQFTKQKKKKAKKGTEKITKEEKMNRILDLSY
jgi:hypothetical protein